ncbi:hypothetical protein GGU11DRAFT_744280 [Lentinula aff. detonsa]|nr:hypothetical protein GGU11DRAFT_744280 [Lentinula aff. detonsa]
MSIVTTQNAPPAAAKKSSRMKFHNTRYGAFPILHRDALQWANQIRASQGKPPLTASPQDSPRIFMTLTDPIEEAGGVKCIGYGPVKPGEPYPRYLIIVSEEKGEWVRIDGEMEPGSSLDGGTNEEIMGAELLKTEGIPHEPFMTCFSNSH